MTDVVRAFGDDPTSVTAARRFVEGRLAGVAQDVRDVVSLMTSELATNAVLHGRSPFSLRLVVTDHQVRVEVTDTGSGTPSARDPSPHDPTGRGLQFVGALAHAWGVVPAAPGDGKTVWFTVVRAGPGPGRGSPDNTQVSA